MKVRRLVTVNFGYAAFATALFLVLLAANLSMDISLVDPGNLPSTIEAFAPLVLVGMAMTPSILSGRGGIDLSLGPLAGLVTIIVAGYMNQGLIGSPFVVVSAMIALGAAVGATNGAVIAYLRVQPIVATLASYLVITGIGQQYVPNNGGTVPNWLNLGGSAGPFPTAVLVLIAVWGVWSLVVRTQLYRRLLAVGQDDRGSYTMGTPVAAVRIVAYAIGGAFAAVGGLVLTSLVSGGDSSIGPSYTLVAIAAVALGGTSLAGGRGGMFGTVMGALDIYLLQNILSLLHVQVFYVNVIYGAILIGAIATNRVLLERLRAFMSPKTARPIPDPTQS